MRENFVLSVAALIFGRLSGRFRRASVCLGLTGVFLTIITFFSFPHTVCAQISAWPATSETSIFSLPQHLSEEEWAGGAWDQGAEPLPKSSQPPQIIETPVEQDVWKRVQGAAYAVPTLTDDAKMTFPRASAVAKISASAEKSTTFMVGSYRVYVLEGNCVLRQGRDVFRAEKMVLWKDQHVSLENAVELGEVEILTPAGHAADAAMLAENGIYAENGEPLLPTYRVLMYLEGETDVTLATPRATSRVKAKTWHGKLFTLNDVSVKAGTQAEHETEMELQAAGPEGVRALYDRGTAHVFGDINRILTQWTPPADTMELPPLEGFFGDGSADITPMESVSAMENRQPTGITPTVEDTPRADSGFASGSGDASILAPSPDFGVEREGRPTREPAAVLIPPTGEEMTGFGGLYPSGRVTPETLSAARLLQGDVSALDPNAAPLGVPSLTVAPRSDVPVQLNLDTKNQQWIGIIDGGVNIIIEGADNLAADSIPGVDKIMNRPGAEKLGTIDISADRVVFWFPPGMQASGMQGSRFTKENMPQELYLEGNIIFRQGDREIHAQRMYFDVFTKRGIIKEAEVFATHPKTDGLLRLRAKEIRVPMDGMYVARDTYVTTSRMGDPLYRFQMDSVMLRSQQRPKVDPRTGLPIMDPRTGEPVMEGPNELTGEGAVVRVGDVPIFYWHRFAIPLERPTTIINKLSLRQDSIFGFQPIIGVDAYRLFGIKRPWTGTDWDLWGSYYTERGPGFGTKFSWDRRNDEEVKLGWFSGPGRGYIDFWGIYDNGEDNLGLGRRHLQPEEKWRYQITGKHRNFFGNGMELKAQIGVMSDRNFQQGYFQNSWYTEADRATQLEVRQETLNRSWSVWTDLRTNDFHTQTQRTPQAEFYWIGQPLLRDTLTWSSYSQVGYVHMYPDKMPTDPNDAAIYNYLDWETDENGNRQPREGYRISTRHEISYPFQAGAVKIVPYVLGELAAWGEDLNGDNAERAYGQVGIRASLPMWRFYEFQSKLLNVNGIMHKVEFDLEASYSAASISADRLVPYDMLDDRSVLDFRHHMAATNFGGLIPWKYDARSYAIRSNLGGWVTSPSTEMADDLVLLRFGMHHRWQTKRGMPGQQRIVDWITFDMNLNVYPDSDRDNFGNVLGMLDYDFRYHAGDRLTFFSSGFFDFFQDGLRVVDVGMILDRPGSGSFFTSMHFLSGPVDNVVMRVGYNYWMSERWVSTFQAAFDVSGKGNLGESFSVTRVGESMLWTLGVSYDAPSSNTGVFFSLEPRFGKRGNVARRIGIPAPGTLGLD